MSNPYGRGLKAVVFDMETMGLNFYRDIIINSGFCEPETGELFQLFAESPADEKQLISDTIKKLGEYDIVITYNGASFDIPYLLTRARKYGIADRLPLFWGIDMYRCLRSYWPQASNMKSLSQKSVEFALGLSTEREDKIGGGECIGLYTVYQLTRNKNDKEKILLHNGDDVRQLSAIYNRAVFLPYHRIAFDKGFGCRKWTACPAVKKNKLTAEGQAERGLLPMTIFAEGFTLDYDSQSGKFSLSIELRNENNMLFADLALVLDTEALKSFEGFAGYHSGYLVIKESGGNINYRESNFLVKSILDKYFQ